MACTTLVDWLGTLLVLRMPLRTLWSIRTCFSSGTGNKDAPLSPPADTDLDRATMRPVNCCTSLTEIGLLIAIIAAHFSGFTYIPRSVSRNPMNLPASTLNTQFFGFSFNLYLVIVVNSSSRSVTCCSLCWEVTTMSSTYAWNPP